MDKEYAEAHIPLLKAIYQAAFKEGYFQAKNETFSSQ
jgi:DnaJ-domain-containing protein 1